MLTWTPVCLPGYKRIKQARASHKRSHRVDYKEVHFALPQCLNIQISTDKIPKCWYTYLVIEVVMKVVAQKQVHQSSLHSSTNTLGKYKFHARVLNGLSTTFTCPSSSCRRVAVLKRAWRKLRMEGMTA